jgi:hypothetical protein
MSIRLQYVSNRQLSRHQGLGGSVPGAVILNACLDFEDQQGRTLLLRDPYLMDRKLRKRAFDLFARHMKESLPTFKPFRAKSLYVWPGEVVWEDAETMGDTTLFIILSPEPKGRDQFTVELGWSRLRRFPELIQRPSLAFQSEFERCYERDEATVRLSSLTDHHSWIDLYDDNVNVAVATQVRNLLDHGIPFLQAVSLRAPL